MIATANADAANMDDVMSFMAMINEMFLIQEKRVIIVQLGTR